MPGCITCLTHTKLCHLIQSSVSEPGHIFSSQYNLKPSPAKLNEQCLPCSGITFLPQGLWTERTTSTEKDCLESVLSVLVDI